MVVSSSILGRVAAPLLFGRPAAVPPARQLAVIDPYAVPDGNLRWFRGDVHVASSWARGRDLPKAIGEYYRTHGYQFLGISDANTYTWPEVYRGRGLTGIPMLLASYPFGDLLAMDMDHWIEASDLQSAVDWIVQDGGLPIVAAPHWNGTPELAAMVRAAHRLFGIEIYNARVAALEPAEADATDLWDELLTAGARVYGFAGSDLRSLAERTTQQRAWLEVLALDSTRESLLGSFRQGAFVASTGVHFSGLELKGRTLTVEADAADALRFLGKGGRLLLSVEGSSGSYTITGTEGYVRVEAQRADGARAWSQPYFLEWR